MINNVNTNLITIEEVKRLLSHQCTICGDNIEEKVNKCVSSCLWNLCRSCTEYYVEEPAIHTDTCACIRLTYHDTVRLERFARNARYTKDKQVAHIVSHTRLGDITDKIDLWKSLSEWYSSSPDDIEQQDIDGRNRLGEIEADILEDLLYRIDPRRRSQYTGNLYIRTPVLQDSDTENTTRQCPGCNITLTRTEDIDRVTCGLCNHRMSWSTMETIVPRNDNEYIVDDFSHHSSQDPKVAEVMNKVYTILPRIRRMSHLSTIYYLLAIDNTIERSVARYTRGYTTAECIRLAAHNKLYRDEPIEDNMTRACILRDMNLNISRFNVWNRLVLRIENDMDITKYVESMVSFYDGARYIGPR